jgi:ATP-dependent exoDNAse (exonuclease V) beta subunit
MAERNNERARDEEQNNVNAGGGRKGANMEENLQQMMGQVEAPKEEAPKEYNQFSEWVEDTIKEPQVPTREQLIKLEAIFEGQKAELPIEFETTRGLIEGFFANAMQLLEAGSLEALNAEIKALSARLNEEMLKGEVDLLFMLKDFEKIGGL